MIRHAYDASTPPSKPLTGCQAALGYIGGNTPHVWTPDEWNAATANGRLRCGPIWVAAPNISVYTQARDAVAKLHLFGWKADRFPHKCMLFLDSETSRNVTFIQEFANELWADGFVTGDYRSLEALTAAPSGLPEWVAHWNVPPGPFTDRQIMFQYMAEVPFDNTTVDLDALDDACWHHLGIGPRRGPGRA